MDGINKVTFSNSNYDSVDISESYDQQDADFFAKHAVLSESQGNESAFTSYFSGAEHKKAGESLFSSATTLNTKEASNITSQIKDLYLKDSLIAKATAKAVQAVEKLTNLQ